MVQEEISVSVIIVSYNNSDVLKQTLFSIKEMLLEPAYETIVVDNASKDNNVLMLEKEFPEISLIKSNTNLGFGKACNLGARYAKGGFLLLVNSDILFQGNPLPEMIAIFNKLEDVGALGVQLHNLDGSEQPSGFRFPGLFMRFIQLIGLKKLILKMIPSIRMNSEAVFKVDFVSGAFLMLEKKLFDEVGGFDERYFMYLEDADLCYQISKRGKMNYLLNRKDIVHLNENHENSLSPFVFYHLNRGHLLFYQKNFSKTKTKILKVMTRLIFNFRLFSLSCTKGSESKANSLKKVLSIYN